MALLDGFRTQGPTDFEGSGGLLLFREPENRVEEQGRNAVLGRKGKKTVPVLFRQAGIEGGDTVGSRAARNN